MELFKKSSSENKVESPINLTLLLLVLILSAYITFVTLQNTDMMSGTAVSPSVMEKNIADMKAPR